MPLRRWVCPKCGRGRNAPTKLRRNDKRRYCLECTRKRGEKYLVEMECPVEERRRVKRKKQTHKKAMTKRRQESKKLAGRRGKVYPDNLQRLFNDWNQYLYITLPESTKLIVTRRRSTASTVRTNFRRGEIHLAAGSLEASAKTLLMREMARMQAYCDGWLPRSNRGKEIAARCLFRTARAVIPGLDVDSVPHYNEPEMKDVERAVLIAFAKGCSEQHRNRIEGRRRR